MQTSRVAKEFRIPGTSSVVKVRSFNLAKSLWCLTEGSFKTEKNTSPFCFFIPPHVPFSFLFFLRFRLTSPSPCALIATVEFPLRLPWPLPFPLASLIDWTVTNSRGKTTSHLRQQALVTADKWVIKSNILLPLSYPPPPFPFPSLPSPSFPPPPVPTLVKICLQDHVSHCYTA